ncbi:UNVERIFIED_CONTAM: hypothetical protein HDU68_003458 [Siphonaria sp. JEL0065]|nr:hypothetical protein HDU68_003458 [Siphonaria sp. JEL0065]
MKLILKYASISGMTFNVQELNEIILKSNESVPYDRTPAGIIGLIIVHDVYQFVKETEVKDVYCFSHFLIQQGILSTMVPSKREEIHSIYADYFLKKMKKAGNKWENIQSVVHHLFQVSGQEERKQITLYTAFLESAEMGMISEAFEFYEALQDFEHKMVMAKNSYEAIRERRLLAFIHLGKGDTVESMAHCSAALALAGYPTTNNKLTNFSRFYKMYRVAAQILSCTDEMKRLTLSNSFANKTFAKAFEQPNVVGKVDLAAIRASVASRRESRRTSRLDSNIHDQNWKIVDEIVQTLELKQKMTPPSFELVEMQGICLILGIKLMKDKELQTASYFANYSSSMDIFGMDKLCKLADSKCQVLMNEFKETFGHDHIVSEIEDSALATIFKARGISKWLHGDWNMAAELIKSSEILLSNRGRGFSDECYSARNTSASLYAIGGNIPRVKALIEGDTKFHLTDENEELHGEFHFRQAALSAEEGEYECAEKWYSQAIEVYSVSLEEPLRTLASMVNALRASIMILNGGYENQDALTFLLERITVHLETCQESTEAIAPLEVSLAARYWISVLLSLIELYSIVCKSVELKGKLATGVLALNSEITKANTPSLLKPLTQASSFCRKLTHGVKLLWTGKGNVGGFVNATMKALKQAASQPWIDAHLQRLIMARLWRIEAMSGVKMGESGVLENEKYVESFEKDGFIYEAELLRQAQRNVQSTK